jgi:chromosome segregation ATPase
MKQATIKAEDYGDVSQERTGIISIVKDLEEQLDTAFKLKKTLENELAATQKKLGREIAARTQLEKQVTTLEAQAGLVDQLRDDISFAKQDHGKLANVLKEAQSQLKAMTKNNDSLLTKVASVETHAKKLEAEKMKLEARIMNLKDKLGNTEQRLGKKVDKQQGQIAVSDNRIVELRAQLEEQKAANMALMKLRTLLEGEIKTSNDKYGAVKKDLDAVLEALREIHSEAARTSGRVRQRYFEPKKAKAKNKK